MADIPGFTHRIKKLLDTIMGEPYPHETVETSPLQPTPQSNYTELKDIFDKAFTLMEENFSHVHPDKHYLRTALKFKLPNTERIDATKQEVSFLTYNTLFARTATDYLQNHHLAHVSVNVLSEPAKVTLSKFNEYNIQLLFTQSLQVAPATPDAGKSFAERIEAERKKEPAQDISPKR